jgi:hypothetical protein
VTDQIFQIAIEIETVLSKAHGSIPIPIPIPIAISIPISQNHSACYPTVIPSEEGKEIQTKRSALPVIPMEMGIQ